MTHADIAHDGGGPYVECVGCTATPCRFQGEAIIAACEKGTEP